VLVDLMRDKSKATAVAGDAAAVAAMRVWHCSYRSLGRLSSYPNLRTLVVATYPDADLEPLAALDGLKYLSVLHLPKVTDVAPLSRLRRLRTVRLETLPSWDSSGKVTTIDSLKPLAELPELAHLELFGVRPVDGSLRDLEAVLNLVSVRVSKYPKQETRRFYQKTDLSDAFAPGPGVSDWH
jgi:hypothetical protein